MTRQERETAEQVIRSLCARYGDKVLHRVLTKTRAISGSLEPSDFASAVGVVVGAVLRDYLSSERVSLENERRDYALMNAVYPTGPRGLKH